MKIDYGPDGLGALKEAPDAVRKAFFKQVGLLTEIFGILPCTPRSTTKPKTSGKPA
jgi:hypothetical protein